jgi:hypothetical protein
MGSLQSSLAATEAFESQHPFDTNSFACFPRLPTELRLDIWELALPDRRTVAFGQTSAAEEFSWKPEHLTVHADKTSLFQTSQESRRIALKTYRLFTFPELVNPVYLRPKYDIILATSTAALLFITGIFREDSSGNPSTRDVRILGFSLGKAHHDNHNTRSAYSRQLRAIAPLYSALRKLNSLQKLVVYYPACMTPGTMEALGAPLTKHFEAIRDLSIANRRADSSSWRIPSIVTGNYDCQADVTEIERGLRALMEQQLELMENRC